MVFTPLTRPADLATTEPLSPLILPSQVSSFSRSPASTGFLIPSAGPSSSTSSYFPKQPLRQSSTSSYSALSEFRLDADEDVDEPSGNGVEGVKHVELSVDATEWRHPIFKTKVLSVLRKLRVPYWTSTALSPTSIHLQRVSGALTNAVFFVSFNPRPDPTSPSMSPLLTPTMPPSDPSHPPSLTLDQYPPTLLFRVYGPSSGALISRTEELRILHVLSETYGLGPRVYGTFLNGRVEQFFPSRALTADELRDPTISRGIARRMRELHSVDLKLLGYPEGKDGEPTLWRCLAEWAALAEDGIATLSGLQGKWETWVEDFGLHRIKREVEAYRNWVEENPGKGKGVVFAHNDAQYGNLLRLDAQLPAHEPDHHRYIVIDFEYAAPNPRGYDIANHFHEWRANYHHPSLSHSLEPHYPYPTADQREDFYRAYLSISQFVHGPGVLGKRKDVADERVRVLAAEVAVWSPGCSVFWALWGVVQAEGQILAILENRREKPEFDYLAYAMGRIGMFRQEATALGVRLES